MSIKEIAVIITELVFKFPHHLVIPDLCSSFRDVPKLTFSAKIND